MISFQQLCEMLTHNQRYSWFYFPGEYYRELLPSELELVYIETTSHQTDIRIWYPKSKWTDRPMGKEELMSMLEKAISVADIETIKQIQQKLCTLKDIK